MKGWAVLVCFAVLACGGGGDGRGDDAGHGGGTDDGGAGGLVSPSANDTSGTRLKRRLYTTDDGFAVQFGWHDADLGVDCDFAVAPDGSIRCVPSAQVGVLTYYRDDACSEPVFGSSVPLVAGEWIYTNVGGCNRRVWTVDQAIDQPATLYQPQVAGCSEVTPVTSNFYQATETAPADMVEGIITDQPSGSRLMSRIRTTSDGARRYRSMYDPQIEAACYDTLTADGTVRCGPDSETSLMSPIAFTDDACTVGLQVYPWCHFVPLYRQSYVDGPSRCRSPVEFVERTIYTGTIYTNSDGCQMHELDEDFVHVLEGDPIDASGLVAQVAFAASEGSTRLRSALVQYQDGSVDDKRSRFGQVWDSKYQAVCRLNEIESDDGQSIKCMPTDYLDAEEVFADPGCSQYLAVLDEPCEEDRRPSFARLHGESFYRVTGEFSGDTVYIGTPSECVATAVPAGVYHFTLDQDPVTDWEVVTEVVEP